MGSIEYCACDQLARYKLAVSEKFESELSQFRAFQFLGRF